MLRVAIKSYGKGSWKINLNKESNEQWLNIYFYCNLQAGMQERANKFKPVSKKVVPPPTIMN